MRNFVSHCCRLLVVVALLVFCMQCFAQGNIRTVLLVKVKMGHDDSWKAAVRDYVAMVKKAGSEQQFTVWDLAERTHASRRSLVFSEVERTRRRES